MIFSELEEGWEPEPCMPKKRSKMEAKPRGARVRPFKQRKVHVHMAVNYSACSECFRMFKATPEGYRYIRNGQLWNKYRIRLEDFERMLAEQGGHCAICPSTEDLALDHDHSCCPGKKACGKCNRGVLCGSCNRALGLFYDDPEKLRKALVYLLG